MRERGSLGSRQCASPPKIYTGFCTSSFCLPPSLMAADKARYIDHLHLQLIFHVQNNTPISDIRPCTLIYFLILTAATATHAICNIVILHIWCKAQYAPLHYLLLEPSWLLLLRTPRATLVASFLKQHDPFTCDFFVMPQAFSPHECRCCYVRNMLHWLLRTRTCECSVCGFVIMPQAMHT